MIFKKKSSGISSRKDQQQTLSITNSFTKKIYCIMLVRSWPGETVNFLSPDPIKLVISEFDYIQVILITLSNVYKLSSCKYFNCTEDSLAIIHILSILLNLSHLDLGKFVSWNYDNKCKQLDPGCVMLVASHKIWCRSFVLRDGN